MQTNNGEGRAYLQATIRFYGGHHQNNNGELCQAKGMQFV